MSPDVETYDLEALTTIVSEDKLWDIGVEPTVPVAVEPAPATRRDIDKSDREFAIEHGLENAPAQEIRAARMTTPAPAPAKPAKRGTKKAPSKPAAADDKEDVDIDSWNPSS